MNSVEINLVNLLYEFKRNIKMIFAVGVIFAVLLAAWNVYSIKNAPAPNFGAESKIVVESNRADATELSGSKASKNTVVARDYSETMEAVVKCDEVLGASITECGIDGMDIATLRNNTYINTSNYGDVVTVVVTNADQKTALALCNAITNDSIVVFAKYGMSATVSQQAVEKGAVSIEVKEETAYPYRSINKISSVAVEQVSVAGLVKKAVLGFVLGVILMYAYCCLRYIVKGIIIYSGEIKDLGMKLLGKWKGEKADEVVAESALSEILIKNGVTKKVAVMKVGNNADISTIKSNWKAHGVDVLESGDILEKPLEKNVVKDADTTVMIVKSNTVKKTDLMKLVESVRSAADFSGVLFIDN